MMIKIALSSLFLFKWVFPLLKVDYAKLRSILLVKLTTDSRRTYLNIHVKPDKKSGKPKNTFSKLLYLHLISGLFLGFLVEYINSFFLAMAVTHFFILTMAVMSLTTHFAVVLLDTTDNIILLHRPVDSRTIFFSRIVHIFFYLFALTAALAFSPWVVGTIKFGAVFCVSFFFTLILSTFLGISLVYMLYLGIMQITKGDKFREAITFIQIVLPLVLLWFFFLKGGGEVELEKWSVSLGTWTYFVPPAWFAGMIVSLISGEFSAPYNWYIVLSIVVPVVCLLTAVIFLAPTFNRKLARMGIASSRKTRPPSRVSLSALMSRIFTRSGKERAVFEMIWKLSSRDSKFNLNSFSLLGSYIGIIFFILIIGPHKDIWVSFNFLPYTRKYIPLLYFSCIILVNAVSQLPFSDKYRAAWLYYALPVTRPGLILSGALKTLVAKFGFLSLIIAVFSLVVWGAAVIDDVLLAFVNIGLFSLLLSFIFLRCLPFSKKHAITNLSGKIIRSLLTLILYIGLAYLHYRLTRYNFAVTAAIIPPALLLLYLSRKYKNTTWENLET